MAVSDAALILRIKGDSSQAQAELKKFKKDLNELDKEAKSTAQGFEALAAKSGLSASQFANLKVGALAAAAGITAIAAVAAATAVALFKLTSVAAEFGSEIFDASQKTGLSAETLSALKIAAEQSGSSFENVSNAVAKFNVLIGNAAAGNEKAAKILADYGITATDTAGALEQAVTKIASMASESDRAAAAGALFKDRTGEILPVIESFKGDLPGLIAELRRLGLLMSEEDAKAADEFGDQMDTLNAQLAAVGRTIGFAVMPVFLKFATSLSDWLSKNQKEVKFWASVVGDSFELVRKGMLRLYDDSRRLLAALQAIAALQTQGQFGPGIALGIIQGTEAQIQADIASRNAPAGVREAGRIRTGIGPRGGDDEDAKKAEELRKKQLAGELGLINAIQEAEKAALEKTTAFYKEEFEARRLSAADYARQIAQEEEKFRIRGLADIEKEFELRRKEQGLASEQLKALQQEKVNELEKLVTESNERVNKAQKEADEQTKKLNEEELKAAKDVMERKVALSEAELAKRIAVVENLAAHEKKTAEEVAKFKQFVEVENLDLRKRELEKYFKLLTVGSKEYLDVQNQIKILEEQLEEQRKKNHTEDRKRHNERIKNWNEYIEKIYQAQKAEDERQQKAAEADAIRLQRENSFSLGGFGGGLAGGLGVDIPLFDPAITDQVQANADFLGKVYEDLAATAGNALGQMAAGLANLALQWLITGEFSATAALKMAAGIALGVAQEAIIKGFFNIAEGLAAAANPFTAWMAPGYFAAAKAYFVTAAIAGAAGVALGLGARAAGGGGKSAQGAFAQQTSGTTQQRNVAGQGQAYSGYGDKAYIQEEGRNAPLGVDVRIKFEDKPAWFTQMFVSEWRANGRIRRLVEDGR